MVGGYYIMRDWIKNIRKLGTNDSVNGKVLNSVIQQVQHNLNLLFSSQNNTRQDKNLTELLYGNLLDYDQIGYKRFVNGGAFDTVEKILSFDALSGNVQLEEVDLYDGDYFMSWFIDEGIIDNIILSRTINIPDALMGQKLVIGCKLMGYVSGAVEEDERFDIYVNNRYCGSNDTKLSTVSGSPIFGTIYGAYDLGSEEKNIKIDIRRSSTNSATPANYMIRVQNMFVGLNTLASTSYELNFPTDLGFLNGVAPDINNFFDFENINVKPIPTFITTTKTIDGGTGNYTINVTEAIETLQNMYYLGLNSSGDASGVDASNRMSVATFFTSLKNTSGYVLSIEGFSGYSNFTFDDGNSYDIIFEGDTTIAGTGLTVTNGTYVNINTDYELVLSNLTVNDSVLKIDNNGATTNKFTTDFLNVNNSNLSFYTVTFSMPVASDGQVKIYNNSHVNITIPSTATSNASATYGIGVSFGPIEVKDNSLLSVDCNNNTFSSHIGYGSGVEKSFIIEDYSNFKIDMEGILSTSSDNKDFEIKKHSSSLIKNMQLDGGVTSFGSYTLQYFSILSTTGIGDLVGSSVQSHIYEY
jgi:hypothetical protein